MGTEDSWIKIDEFCQLSHLSKHKVIAYINDGILKSKEENGETYIEAGSGASAIIPKTSQEMTQTEESLSGAHFVEKTIGTILSLHEKVLESKDETISAVKNENQFLKDALFQMQDIYDDDKKTIDTLNEQLKVAQEELQFMKRKYRLMWGRVTGKEEKENGGEEEDTPLLQ